MPLVFENISTNDLILQYGKRGIIVSGGPACTSNSNKPSHVLKAIGVPENEINNSIRISFNDKTTLDDLKKFLEVTKEILGAN